MTSAPSAATPAAGPVAAAGRSPAVRCAGLVKQYPRVTAVAGLDLEIPAGEFFGLLGPNGAGKSTTVGMLTTRVIPTAGRAEVGGVDVVTEPARARALLAAVTQTNTLDRSLTVWENLYLHGRYFRLGRPESRRRADELLERFRLTDRAGSMVAALSGGMAQRLMIARALVHEPRVLFLDEPTSGLDPQARLNLWELLRGLHAAGQTILLTTHYIEEADALCDRVAIMDRGRIVALDTPERLKATVGASRVAVLTVAGDAAVLRDAVAGLPGIVGVEVEGRRLRVMASSADGLVTALVRAVGEGGDEVTDLTVGSPSLETVFLRLTGRELDTSDGPGRPGAAGPWAAR